MPSVTQEFAEARFEGNAADSYNSFQKALFTPQVLSIFSQRIVPLS